MLYRSDLTTDQRRIIAKAVRGYVKLLEEQSNVEDERIVVDEHGVYYKSSDIGTLLRPSREAWNAREFRVLRDFGRAFHRLTTGTTRAVA